MKRYNKNNRRRFYKNHFWKGVKKYGFINALKWEFLHTRKYPQYPFWIYPMVISMVIIAIISFFYSINYLSFIFYLFEIFIVGYLMYRLIRRLDRIHIHGSLLRLWGLKLLSGVVSAIGFIIWYFTLFSFFLAPLEMLLNQEGFFTQFIMFGYQFNIPFIFPMIFEVIGFSLLLIGAYLFFKFQMGSGQIIWVGRI